METKAEKLEVFTYETRSLDDAAVALALGAEVYDMKREVGERFFTFYLRGGFDIKSVALQLASRTLKINAYDVLEANRRIKSLVHSK